MTKDMTTGSSAKQIISFALPLLIGNVFQQFYNMVDGIIVGHFVSKEALAAVGSTGSINFLIIGFVLGVASGFCIPVSQFFGAKNYASMRKTVANMIYLAVIISLVLTVVTMLYTKNILILMQTPDNIIQDAYDYIIIIFAGISATMFYNILAGLLRALGDSRSPLLFLVFSSITNVILDIVLILVFHMGVSGAGYATVAAQLLSGALCLLYIIHKRKELKLELKKEDFIPSGLLIRKLLYLGLPMAFQFSITAIGSIILQSSVNALGSDKIAAITSGNKISMIFTQPMESLGITMATFCGQNVGAGKTKRAAKGVNQCILMSLVYSAAAALIMWIFGGKLALLFVKKEETEVIALIEQLFRVVSSFYPFLGILFVYRNTIQGLGYGVPAMLAGLFELIARSIIGIFFVPAYGYIAACFASPLAWIFAVLLLVPVYYIVIHKLKKKQSIVENPQKLSSYTEVTTDL
jgi:putative MATE family efflux protein